MPGLSRARWTVPLALFPALLQPPDALRAQHADPTGPSPNRYSHPAPLAQAVRTAVPIAIDGQLDEEAWARAPVVSHFTQNGPSEGEPVTQRTEVRILYDDDALYFGASFFDSGPISTRLMRRDMGQGDFDFLMIGLDSYHDHQTAYTFFVNPSGTRRDAIQSGGGGGADTSWDPVWGVETRVSEEGWFAEVRIPFSQLRFSRDEVQAWGLQLERRIHRNQETAVFAFTPSVERGGIARYGHLEGIEGIRPGRQLELLPYLATRAEFTRVPPPTGTGFSNPFRSGSDYFTDVGLDLKFGLTSNLTLDATVNPDFGQVEADPAVINLTAFETRFDERRPFFVEGAEIFRFSEGGPGGSTGRAPQLLYSRRIGRAPQGSVPGSAVYSDAPIGATILGAAKLTGKTADGWSLGLLQAVTARESAPWVDADGDRHALEVEPLTNHLVGRARGEFRGNLTRLGVIATAMNRSLDEGAPLAAQLHASAYTGGIDFAHEWADRSWKLSAALTGSRVAGSAAALQRTQRSAVRYFHRPDASHLSLDPQATSLSGYYAMLDLGKQAGLVQGRAAVAWASPGFEANDLGFQTAADRISLDTNFAFIQTRPGRFFQRWDIRGGPDAVWNYGGDRVQSEFNLFGNLTLLNFWGFGWRLAYNPEVANDRLTRGGPIGMDPRGQSGNLSVNSDSRRSLVGRSSYQWALDDGGSWRHSANLNLNYRPRDNWQILLGPTLTRSFTAAQFVTARPDALADATSGIRFVFGSIEQTTVGLETRLNVTFTPRLSLELYAQPFLSSGSYGPLKEFRTPGRFEFLEYGRDAGVVTRDEDGFFTVDPDGDGPALSFRVADPDFNLRSLLGNAVLRWEWRPGSTLFLVWQQTRTDRITGQRGGGGVGEFDLGRELREMVGIRPENVLLIKVSYWLSR